MELLKRDQWEAAFLKGLLQYYQNDPELWVQLLQCPYALFYLLNTCEGVTLEECWVIRSLYLFLYLLFVFFSFSQ